MGLLRAKNAFYTLHIPVLLLYKWTDHWLNGGGGGGGWWLDLKTFSRPGIPAST